MGSNNSTIRLLKLGHDIAYHKRSLSPGLDQVFYLSLVFLLPWPRLLWVDLLIEEGQLAPLHLHSFLYLMIMTYLSYY